MFAWGSIRSHVVYSLVSSRMSSACGMDRQGMCMRLSATLIRNSKKRQEVHLICDTQAEALLYSADGQIIQGLSEGDGNQRRISVAVWKKDSVTWAEPGRAQTFFVEMACNRMFGAGKDDMIAAPDPNVTYTFQSAHLVVWDPIAWDLVRQFSLLVDLSKVSALVSSTSSLLIMKY